MRKNSKILSIQALRGIAAALVVIFHAQLGLVRYKDDCLYPSWLNRFQLTRELGAFGVDLFFVISGVVFTYVLWDMFAKPHTVPLFLKKRIIRIFPIYWIFLAAWAALFFVKSVSGKELFNAEEVAFSFFLVPWPDGSNRGAYTLFVAWALSYELYFYMLVATCLCFARRYFLPIICCAVVAGNVFLSPSARFPVLTILSSPLMFEFIYGILIGYALRLCIRVPVSLALWALLLSLALLVLAKSGSIPSEPRGYWLGIPAALCVMGAVFLERGGKIRIPGWLTALGDSSYSLYLSHPLILRAQIKILDRTDAWASIPADVLILTITLVSIAVGQIVYLWLEKPLTAWLSRRFTAQVVMQA